MPGKPIPGGGKGGKKKVAQRETISKKPSGPPTRIPGYKDPTKPRPGEKVAGRKPPKRTATSRPRPGVGPKPIVRPVRGR